MLGRNHFYLACLSISYYYSLTALVGIYAAVLARRHISADDMHALWRSVRVIRFHLRTVYHEVVPVNALRHLASCGIYLAVKVVCHALLRSVTSRLSVHVVHGDSECFVCKFFAASKSG